MEAADRQAQRRQSTDKMNGWLDKNHGFVVDASCFQPRQLEFWIALSPAADIIIIMTAAKCQNQIQIFYCVPHCSLGVNVTIYKLLQCDTAWTYV